MDGVNAFVGVLFSFERTEGCHWHSLPGPWELLGLCEMKLNDSGFWNQVDLSLNPDVPICCSLYDLELLI